MFNKTERMLAFRYLRSRKRTGFVSVIAGFSFLVKRLPSSRLWSKVVLKDQSEAVRGYVSSPPKHDLLGKEGEVYSELRPSGSVIIDGVPVDVVSEGTFIPKGEKVRVVAVEGARVVVRKV